MSRIIGRPETGVDRAGNPYTRVRALTGCGRQLVKATVKGDGGIVIDAWRLRDDGRHKRNPDRTMRGGSIERMFEELGDPLEHPEPERIWRRVRSANAGGNTTVTTYTTDDGRTAVLAARDRGGSNSIRIRMSDMRGKPVADAETHGWEDPETPLAASGIHVADPCTPLELLETELALNGLTVGDVTAWSRCDDPVWTTPIDPQGDTPGLIAWTDGNVWFTARDENGGTYWDSVPRNPPKGQTGESR